MCIIAREVCGKDTWKGRRSGETIGYHQGDEEVHILTTLYLENQLNDDEKNYVELLHPGNVTAELIKDEILPCHRDETARGVQESILYSLYSPAFDIKRDGKSIKLVSQIKALSAWDTWCQMKEPTKVNWAGDKRTLNDPPRLETVKMDPLEVEVHDGFTPFTAWKIGPFTKNGPVLMSVEIKLTGESYRELVTRYRTFSIDGPEHLLSRIEYTYIPRLDKEKRCVWEKKLNDFRTYISAGQSYDIVLLGRDFADEVEVLDKSSATEASLQLGSKDKGVRYITDDPNFSLTLKYVKPRVIAAV